MSKKWIQESVGVLRFERRTFVEEYHRNGLTQRVFVEKHGISLASLTNWLRVYGDATPEKAIGLINLSFPPLTIEPLDRFRSLRLSSSGLCVGLPILTFPVTVKLVL